MTHYDDEVLSRFIDGELTSSERADVSSHLAVCARCRDVVADLEFLRETAAGLPELEPPARVWEQVQEMASRSIHRRLGFRWLWAAIPALATVLVVVTLSTDRQRSCVLATRGSFRSVVSDADARADTHGLQSASVTVVSPVQRSGVETEEPCSWGGVEKVTPEEAGVEPDDEVLAAAAEYMFYLEGLERAIVESEEAMRTNPGHPRVRMVNVRAKAGAARSVRLLLPEGD